MSEMNGFVIQEKLRSRKHVSVPWIQREFQLSYQDAKEFLSQLISRGWVSSQAEGICYPVCGGRLWLRKLRRTETDGLIADMTPDCGTALECVSKKQDTGATLSQLVTAVRGESDTADALEILKRHALVYFFDGLYFPCVSKRTVQVLVSVGKAKRRSEMGRSLGRGLQDDWSIKKLFEELFDE